MKILMKALICYFLKKLLYEVLYKAMIKKQLHWIWSQRGSFKRIKNLSWDI